MNVKRAAGLGTLAWVAWRLFGPEFAPRFPGVQERPTRLGGRTLLIGHHEFFVREAGDGPPLVLLHGWGYDSLATWHRMLPPLAEHHRVIAIDDRNHGRSDSIRGSFDIEDLADDVAGVMDAVGVPSAPIVGYSMGGMVAQVLAFRHPTRVTRLVLAATAAYPIPRRRVLTAAVFRLARALGKVSIIEWARLTHRYLLRQDAIDPQHSRWLWETLLDRDTRLSFESGFAIWRFDSRPWAGKISQPTLVIIPTSDQLVEPGAQHELAALLPNAVTSEIAGARHEAALTHSDEIVKAIEGFLG